MMGCDHSQNLRMMWERMSLDTMNTSMNDALISHQSSPECRHPNPFGERHRSWLLRADFWDSWIVELRLRPMPVTNHVFYCETRGYLWSHSISKSDPEECKFIICLWRRMKSVQSTNLSESGGRSRRWVSPALGGGANICWVMRID